MNKFEKKFTLIFLLKLELFNGLKLQLSFPAISPSFQMSKFLEHSHDFCKNMAIDPRGLLQ